MEVKFKKLHPDAIAPQYFNGAGADLSATYVTIDEFNNVVYGTGLSVEIPEGYVGLIFPRSSIYKKNLILSNSVGVIDSSYRGEILFKFRKIGDTTNRFEPPFYDTKERIGQIIIMPYPVVDWVEVNELSDTERGVNGFGSTGQ